jgi:hypothetical protein
MGYALARNRTRMRMRLQFVLMALPAIAISFLTPPPAQAAGDSGAAPITSTQENGRTVYTNDSFPTTPGRRQRWSPAGRSYVYWSVTEHRWKPVPGGPAMRAARSAAAEVRRILTEPGATSHEAGEFFSPERIDSAIEEAAARHHVDANLVRAVIKVESNFNPHAISPKGAMGLMQLMPATARELKVSDAFDPEQNVEAGVKHLRKLLDDFGGDARLALAAYNAGSRAVLRNAGVPPYAETQNYVKRITGLYWNGQPSGMGLGTSRAPVRVFRDGQGVLTMTNVE